MLRCMLRNRRYNMYGFTTEGSEPTRGMKINNPCNIRISSASWQGKITPSSDTAFEQFSEVTYGIRAACVIFLNYQRFHGLRCTAELISRWAPPSDHNPTNSYIDYVSKYCGVNRYDPVNLHDPKFMLKFISAVIHQEQGCDCCTSQQIQDAVNMSLPTV